MRGTRIVATSIGAVTATGADFQLSRRWYKISVPKDVGVVAVQTAF